MFKMCLTLVMVTALYRKIFLNKTTCPCTVSFLPALSLVVFFIGPRVPPVSGRMAEAAERLEQFLMYFICLRIHFCVIKIIQLPESRAIVFVVRVGFSLLRSRACCLCAINIASVFDKWLFQLHNICNSDTGNECYFLQMSFMS